MAHPPARAPIPSPDSLPFWEAARQGQFRIMTCRDCGSAHWPPRPICPFCTSSATEWRDSAGTGEIHSCTVATTKAGPSIIAYVLLDEGVCMLSNIVDCEADKVAIGMKVAVTFRDAVSDFKVPMFAPRL